MVKLVVLKVGKGNFGQGFPVTLQIGDEGAAPSSETTGELPPDLTIPHLYQRWQSRYRHLDLPGRPIGLPKGPRPSSQIQDCQNAAQDLRDRFNHWLEARPFRRIREKWLEQLDPAETIRAVIQTNDPQLRRLPWHLWDVMERYPQAEIALSPQDFGSHPQRVSKPNSQVHVLAILGNSQGIDIQHDRSVLEQLPDASVTFLVEPDRQQLSDRLWEQRWEILFFAGHSRTQGADEAGLIHLNQDESLSLSELKHALEKAVERGLKLAIFNSCDGLGLARELAYLQIPQLIVMREPVPDRVAHEFLKYFLSAYASEKPLYLAVREARQRLQALESQFPCATWLPVICQHPAAIPPTWQELLQQSGVSQPGILPPSSPPPSYSPFPPTPAAIPKPKLIRVLLTSVLLTGLVMGLRAMGTLQPWELKALDHLIQLRPKEKPDSRLLLIEVTEKSVRVQNQQDLTKPRDISLSNASLDRLLAQLAPLQPAVIGLDIYRDYPAGKKFPKLAARLQKSDRLITVCRTGDENQETGDPPPPEVSAKQALARMGFSNVVPDQHGIIRRHLLAMDSSQVCPAQYSLGTQLALHYLANQGIFLQFTPDGNWQFGNTVISLISAPAGGYVRLDGRGHQILLNYRSPINGSSFHTPQEAFPRISLGAALAGGLKPELVHDRIVLIGTTAASFKDYWPTPYTDEQGRTLKIPGVNLQAQMVSQLISAVLDHRPLLWPLPFWADVVWVSGWALLGGLLAVYLRWFVWWSVASALAIAALYGLCLVLLVQFGSWVPLVPAAIALVASLGIHRMRLLPSTHFSKYTKISHQE